MSNFITERAIEIVTHLQDNVEECCEASMDKDEVEQLLIELQELLIDIRNQNP